MVHSIHYRLPGALNCLLLGTALFVLSPLGCQPDEGPDEDRVVAPPSGCSNQSLSNVGFSFNIHFDGEDYPQERLLDLLAEYGSDNFNFFFEGEVTELGVDPESGDLAITVTEVPKGTGKKGPVDGGDDGDSGDDDDDDSAGDDDDSAEPDPNSFRVVYQLPFGYELPTEMGQAAGVHIILDLSTGELIRGFSLWEPHPDSGWLPLFLVEPSDIGLAYGNGQADGEGPEHPFFFNVGTRDRACPNLATLQCAKPYNLSLVFETPEPPEGDDDDSAGDDDDSSGDGSDELLPYPGPESFELYPTEHVDFVTWGVEMRIVNVWSYAYREVEDGPGCDGFDWTSQRFSYFVTRSSAAPAN